MSNPRFRNLFVWVLVGIVLLMIILSVRSNNPNQREISISDLAKQIRNGEAISTIKVEQNVFTVTYAGGSQPSAIGRKETGPLVDQLKALNVTEEQLGRLNVEVAAPSDWTPFLQLLTSLLPLILIAGFIYLMLRQAQGANNQASDMISQLERLAQLRADGVISEEEFRAAKARLLGL